MLEFSGVYAEGYIEEQRRQRAEAMLRSVEGRLATAHRRVDSTEQEI